MKKLIFLLLPTIVWGQNKVYVRVSEGTKPFNYQFFKNDGTLAETRQSSTKDEEAFNSQGYGYSWKVTDANGATVTGGVDAISHQLMNKPVRMKSMYFYSDAIEASSSISDVQSIPGFNTAGVIFHPHQMMNTPALFNHSRWNQVYDHTLPNQTFTQDQDKYSLDRMIYNAYNTGNSIQNRIQLRITISGSLLREQLDANWAYGIEDLPLRPDYTLAHQNASLGYRVAFQSYASDRGLNFFKQVVKKFCYRYQKAINDGTITTIAFQLNESGESNPTARYYNPDDSYTEYVGDYSVMMRQKFIDFCVQRFGTIQVFNQKMQSNIPAFTLDAFNSNMLNNNADGGNNTVQSLWQWYQQESHNLFEYEAQRYAYEQVPLTRSKLWCFDVGSIMNGDFFRMKSFNFAQRLLKNDRWMMVKSNNSHEFNAGPFVVDQILSAARMAGAQPCWEPSPALNVYTTDFLTEAAQLCIQNSISLSVFSANKNDIPEHIESKEFWQNVSARVNLAGQTTTFKTDDLDGSGNIVTLRIPFLTVALQGKYDYIGDSYVHQKWQEAKNANPGKRINIRIDDSDIRALFVNTYPL